MRPIKLQRLLSDPEPLMETLTDREVWGPGNAGLTLVDEPLPGLLPDTPEEQALCHRLAEERDGKEQLEEAKVHPSEETEGIR